MIMNYWTMKLLLTAVEHDEAQVALARIARRKTFTYRERVAKRKEMFAAMKRKDLLVEEIRELERPAV
jgi:hypothetical protein